MIRQAIKLTLDLLLIAVGIWIFSKLVGIKFTYIMAYILTLLLVIPISYILYVLESSEQYNAFLSKVDTAIEIEKIRLQRLEMDRNLTQE